MKKIVLFVLLIYMGMVLPIAIADESKVDAYAEELRNVVSESEQKAFQRAESSREKINEAVMRVEKTSEVSPKFEEEDSREVISKLLDKVEDLKSKVVVNKRVSISTETPKKANHVGSKTVYPYIEGKLFEIHCGVDKVTDVALEAGERLTDSPVSGDTVRWKVASVNSGEGSLEITHLIIKPLEDELETNLIVTTNRRVYHLRLVSGDWYMPQVSWNYPGNDALKNKIKLNKAKEVESINLSPEKLRFDYEIEGKKCRFRPELIFDDGVKTYVRMPKDISSSEAPALFILNDEDEAMLVNYRVKGRFYIVDRIFERAQLKIGKGEGLTIYSPSYERGFFSRIF